MRALPSTIVAVHALILGLLSSMEILILQTRRLELSFGKFQLCLELLNCQRLVRRIGSVGTIKVATLGIRGDEESRSRWGKVEARTGRFDELFIVVGEYGPSETVGGVTAAVRGAACAFALLRCFIVALEAARLGSAETVRLVYMLLVL